MFLIQFLTVLALCAVSFEWGYLFTHEPNHKAYQRGYAEGNAFGYADAFQTMEEHKYEEKQFPNCEDLDPKTQRFVTCNTKKSANSIGLKNGR